MGNITKQIKTDEEFQKKLDDLFIAEIAVL